MKTTLLSIAFIALLGSSAAPSTAATTKTAGTATPADFYAFGYADGVDFKNSNTPSAIQEEISYAQGMYQRALQTQGRGEVDYWRGYLNGLNS